MDGTAKNGSRCLPWSQYNYADAYFDAPHIQSIAFGYWTGGGAVNQIWVYGTGF